jgi:thioredoxin 1
MNVSGKYNIRGIPTLLVFKGGQVADQIVGAQPKENIVKILERHIS